MIGISILFLAGIFLSKNKTIFQKNEGDAELSETDGLAYTNSSIGDLVNKDTDGDEVLDWEEGLWGTDPTKKDTDGDGIMDDKEIEKLKSETVGNDSTYVSTESNKKLTETDKFSDQFFATIAALSQNGALDETTIDQVTTKLAESIGNSNPSKIYTIKNIKVQNDESKAVMQEYNIKLQALQAKYPLNENVEAILSESVQDNGEIDATVFKKFDPIINQLNGIVKGMLVISPPKSLALLHVVVINGFQKLSDNLTAIKMVDTDTIVAFGAINQYEKNSANLEQYVNKLLALINQKLNN